MAEITPRPIELKKEHAHEIERLGAEMQAHIEAHPEIREAKNNREILREVLETKMNGAHQAIHHDAGPIIELSEDIKRVKEKEKQFDHLLNFMASHGPIQASLLAKKIGDPWLEDRLHDLILKLHDELVKTKQLQEE